MALDDRDYMQEAERFSPGKALREASLATRLILANVAVFLLWQAVGPGSAWMRAHFMVSAEGLLGHLRVWTLVSSGFSHLELWHLFWNMLFLYWFVPMLEERYGSRPVLGLYLLGAVGCGLAQVGLQLLMGDPRGPMLGASGAVMAVVVVAALAEPQRKMLLWMVLPVPLWAMAGLYVGFDVLGVIEDVRGRPDGVAHAGHLGGALAGAALWAFSLRGVLAPSPGGGAGGLLARLRRPKLRVLPPLPPEERPAPPAEDAARIDAQTAERVDDLLRKISAEGLGSLSAQERRFLEDASKLYRR